SCLIMALKPVFQGLAKGAGSVKVPRECGGSFPSVTTSMALRTRFSSTLCANPHRFEELPMSDLPEKELTRRGFLTRVGGGIVAANLAGAGIERATVAQQVLDPPGKKLGWAIVGLGSLSINQILPAFAKCEKSKVVAFVSGHPDKANKLALRYGVNPKNIYNYQNYDTIKDNPEVDIIY